MVFWKKYLVFNTHDYIRISFILAIWPELTSSSVSKRTIVNLLFLACPIIDPSWSIQLLMPFYIDPNTNYIHCLKRQKYETYLLLFLELSLDTLETVTSGCFLQLLKDGIPTSKENADSYMTKLKVTGKTKHLFRSYSVCFYRAMLPQILILEGSLMLTVLYTFGSVLTASWKPVLCYQIQPSSGHSTCPLLFLGALHDSVLRVLPLAHLGPPAAPGADIQSSPMQLFPGAILL